MHHIANNSTTAIQSKLGTKAASDLISASAFGAVHLEVEQWASSLDARQNSLSRTG